MTDNIKRLPAWLKRGIIDIESSKVVRNILKENGLNTVCEEARCPNKAECFAKKTATFMIYIFRTGQISHKVGLASAMSVVLISIILIILILIFIGYIIYSSLRRKRS